MGTNYYFTTDTCPMCGHSATKIHIGKSSAGWCFALAIHPELGINSLADWEEFWQSKIGVIRNEYGELLTNDQMVDIITNRSWDLEWTEERSQNPPSGYTSWYEFLKENYAIRGPNGLLRAEIREGHCISHGDGTYDLCIGEFS